ncbi:MAG TPA: polysaccharide pyruvyl transferase family protein, partial [Candidatus Saccharimonadaceae bacterium]|nr:polysaccharide pyruvyl transferase family protein [Candidatus Saccharimonadaceae bacterium]
MTKVLLINSDLAANRGDRAIAEGNIELIKRQFPDAEITGLSEHPFRDRKWYGIDFINMNFQSLGILDFFRLAHAARRSDIILWGGGEILKDYTNKAALWYWAAKISFLSLINPDIYGAFQGIGPTRSQRSKRTIARVVGHCKLFMVRDQESADKLVEWGVDPAKIRAAADPAILPKAEAIDDALAQKLQASYDIDDAFLDDFICVGPRDWFHYKPGGIIPFKYKKPLYKLIGRSVITREDPRHARYVAQLGSLIARLSHDHPQRHILFIPMHMSETDSWLCNKLRQ